MARSDAERIFHDWHRLAQAGDVQGLLALYDEDAVFESPLVPILTGGQLRLCRGRDELRRFLTVGIERRPAALVRWYRTGDFLTDGRTLIWEYPRQTPGGEQIDICEVMGVADGQIVVHRIYWGWLGVLELLSSARARATPALLGRNLPDD